MLVVVHKNYDAQVLLVAVHKNDGAQALVVVAVLENGYPQALVVVAVLENDEGLVLVDDIGDEMAVLLDYLLVPSRPPIYTV